MKVAVIGGGTAGYLACVHLTKEFPQCDLYHIYDPNIPTIGVGEGTTPDVSTWLTAFTGASFELLAKECYATKKYGIQFENWGRSHIKFTHNFYPIDQQYAYHISAAKLVDFLQKFVVSTHIPKKVINIESNWEMARITFNDGTFLDADFVFDAQGFPRELTENHLKMSFIPTNAALIRSSIPVQFTQATRSVARPHGWVFVIPLTSRTAYGYIYNSNINTPNEIEEDLALFFEQENISCDFNEPSKQLKFPSFVQRRFFDGSVFKIGNAASFLEPLEATSISFTLTQIRSASYWPLQKWVQQGKKGQRSSNNLEVTNQYLCNYLRQLAFFIGWHYYEGSIYNTEFWKFAKANFQEEIQKPENRDLRNKFNQFWTASHHFPHPHLETNLFAEKILSTFASIERSEKLNGPSKKSGQGFGLFSELSFAEVGQGIGHKLGSIPV